MPLLELLHLGGLPVTNLPPGATTSTVLTPVLSNLEKAERCKSLSIDPTAIASGAFADVIQHHHCRLVCQH